MQKYSGILLVKKGLKVQQILITVVYFTISEIILKGAKGVIIVYSITDLRSFAQVEKWMETVNKHIDPGSAKFLIVGNKCDLEYDRKVTTAAGMVILHEQQKKGFSRKIKSRIY